MGDCVNQRVRGTLEFRGLRRSVVGGDFLSLLFSDGGSPGSTYQTVEVRRVPRIELHSARGSFTDDLTTKTPPPTHFLLSSHTQSKH